MLAPTAGAADPLVIATGGTGGVYYPYGQSLAPILAGELDGREVRVSETAGSVENMQLIGSGNAGIAFVLGDTAFDAVNGNAPFATPVPGRALATLYNNYTQIVTRADSGLTSLADLAGKRVSLGASGSGTAVIANRILTAAGIDPATGIEPSQLDLEDSATALTTRKIDAFFWSGGLPTPAIDELAPIGITLIPSGDITATLQETYGAIYSTATIPAGTYHGQTTAVDVVAVPNLLVVNESMDAELAYTIVSTLFDHANELADTNPAAAGLSPESAATNAPIPYHEGAIRYYQEHGIPIATPVK
jgi:TRAP transporter TAXI family solute receptor